MFDTLRSYGVASGEASMTNLWTMKTILRSFGLTSDLKVNYSKSSIMGVNVDSNFSPRIGSTLFIYLGLPVGANPRKESTWEPLIQ